MRRSKRSSWRCTCERNVYPFETGIDTKLIYPTSQLLSALTGVGVQPNKAVVGRNAFAHESGVHQHGVIKDRRTYEIMTPESVGAPPTRLVLGRHSGTARGRRAPRRPRATRSRAPRSIWSTTVFCARASRASSLGDDDLIQIALDNRPPPNPPYTIALVQASAGTVRPATATVRLTREGQTYVACALGDGPVDAVCTCIDSITGHPARVVGYELRAISEGRDAEGEVSLRVIIDDRMFSGRAVGPTSSRHRRAPTSRPSTNASPPVARSSRPKCPPSSFRRGRSYAGAQP